MPHEPEPWPELASEDIDAVLTFLPTFSQPRYTAGTWHFPSPSKEGGLVFGWWEPSSEVNAFIATLYDHHWVVPFIWMEDPWATQARRLVEDSGLVARADLETLRKLLTTHARADRFAEGHWGEMFECGHVLAISRRLRELSL